MKNRPKSIDCSPSIQMVKNDFVTIWDPPVESNIGLLIPVVELLIIGYFFVSIYNGFVLGFKELNYKKECYGNILIDKNHSKNL